MASKAKMIGSTEATQPETAVKEREVLLRSTHELEDWLQAERELTK